MHFFRFHKRFFIATLVVFLVEVGIALFVHDNFIRPFVGDVIVVWLVYYFLRTFLNMKSIYLAWFTLVFACAVETAQYYKVIQLLGLQNHQWARVVIGTSFSWWDLLCYVVGFVFLFLLDKNLRKNN